MNRFRSNLAAVSALTVVLSVSIACAQNPVREQVTESASNLCEGNEDVIFSCALSSKKLVSLCQDAMEGKQSAQNINYRFGLTDNLELSFPESSADQPDVHFFYNHYSRYKTDYYNVGFSLSKYEYRIFRNYQGELKESPEYGVQVVSDKFGLDESYGCASDVVDNLHKLEGLLPCDMENALGCDRE